MNFAESIEWLGQVNSGACFPKREEEIDKSLPYFNVTKDDRGRYQMSLYNYEFHDNAPRMQYVAQYLLNNIFPYVRANLSGFYNIQLHDTYTYLEDNKDYKNVLCFGKFKHEKGPVQLPDCYFIGDWGGKYRNIIDNMEWTDKKSKIIFAGTTTGSRDPKKNVRINTCIWALDKPICDCYITNIAQIEPRRIFNDVPEFKYIYRPPIPMTEQIKYRYQLVIDGNTCRWNPDVYFTNTLALHMPTRDMLWYYPLLREKEHYIDVTTENMESQFNYYESNHNDTKRIIANANNVAKQLFTMHACQKYTIALFENIASNK